MNHYGILISIAGLFFLTKTFEYFVEQKLNYVLEWDLEEGQPSWKAHQNV